MPLLAIDALLIAAHIVLGALLPKIPHAFNIAFDGSLGESFNYTKWATVVAALAIAAQGRRSPGLAAFAFTFLVVLADDALQIHERLGHAIAAGSLAPWLGLAGSHDLGEAVVMGCLALAVAPALLSGYIFSDRFSRQAMMRLTALVAVLAIFGAGIDQAHGLFEPLPYGIQIADLLEDGGEMLMASLITAFAVALMRIARR